MSTTRSLEYQIKEEEERRIRIKYEQERLNLNMLKVQQSASQLYHQGNALDAQKNQLADHAQAIAGTGERLQAMEHNLNRCREQLKLNRQELQNQIDTLYQLQADACHQSELLDVSITKARDALAEAAKLSDTLLDNSRVLTDAALDSRYSQKKQEQLENQIKQTERELDFVLQESALRPAAMVTLSAMRKNGYQLRQVISKDGLISYFEEAESGRQIAVKFYQPTRPGENERNWEMLTETFNMVGEQCLDEISDFETAVEEQGIGKLLRGKISIYPKDNRGRSLDRSLLALLKKISLPKPPKPIKRLFQNKSRAGNRQKER